MQMRKRVEILEPILRALWITVAPVAIFWTTVPPPSPTLIGIVSAMTRRGRSAVAKSWPAVDPEGRDARAVSQSENVQFLCRARGQGARSLAPVAFVDRQRDSRNLAPHKATTSARMANSARNP